MDIARINDELQLFIKRHRTSFYAMASREAALLEMGALVVTSEHYRLAGYAVGIDNQQNGFFNIKLSSRGHPFNFSWFTCRRGSSSFEVHSNLAVGGAHKDKAIYVVDVAVVIADKVPRKKSNKKWHCLSNTNLITFVEVKKLVIYPMLLAQFVGIVHEIKPKLLQGSATGFKKNGHFYPTLISLGYLKGTSGHILDGFHRRNYKLGVIPNFDYHLSRMRSGSVVESPFDVKRAIV
jgi:hypothetical protein